MSLGNKVDVSGNDLLLHWWNDPRTDVIGLYLESFGNPRKFGRLARLVGRTKPVLVVKGGRSTGGRRAGVSHTAAAATPDTAVDALFAQSGVLRMETVEELVETARVLSGRPLPKGRGWRSSATRVAPECWRRTRRGPRASKYRSSVQRRPAEFIEATGAVGAGNPVDLGAAATPRRPWSRRSGSCSPAARSMRVLVTYAATRAGDIERDLRRDRAAAGGRDRADPRQLSRCDRTPRRRSLLADGSSLPVFAFPETAVRALDTQSGTPPGGPGRKASYRW